MARQTSQVSTDNMSRCSKGKILMEWLNVVVEEEGGRNKSCETKKKTTKFNILILSKGIKFYSIAIILED